MLLSKITDIVDSVSATMESMLQASEVNLISKLSHSFKLSLDEKIVAVRGELVAVFMKIAEDNQILANEIMLDQTNSFTYCHIVEEQLKMFLDDVKKRKERVVLRSELHQIKSSANVHSDEITA